MVDRFEVVVIGGGPAGSVAARSIAAAGYSVALLEKQPFPRETLCGEFLSVEVVETIRELGLEAEFRELLPNPLTTFTLLSGRGGPLSTPLGFTAYGVKRGKFDAMLLAAANAEGVAILQPAEVTGVERNREGFLVRYKTGGQSSALRGSWVVGAYGKSSPLDRRLFRSFAGTRTGFTGVKFHVPAGMLRDIRKEEIVIALGPGMYCGVGHVGDETATVCFLEQRKKGDPPSRERVWELAHQNPDFARVVTPRVLTFFLTTPVYGTGNLFFGSRDVVENGVLMVGDSAGMIAPLAGDGIGMALQQARLLGTLFAGQNPASTDRESLIEKYRRESSKLFGRRKRIALFCQRMALSKSLRPIITPLLSFTPGLLQATILATRGREG